MKITIITVSFNALKNIESTIKSVLSQIYPDIEYIIIDGGSTDGTLNIIQKYKVQITHLISEPDKGIYDAMNKGINLASGDWILFMNAGDTFVNDSVLSDVLLEAEESVDVIFGDNILLYPKNRIYHTGKYFSKNDINLPFCHQSVLVKTYLAKQTKFDLQYKVAADFKFFYLLHKQNKIFIHVPIAISNYDMQGFSQQNVVRTFNEVRHIQERDKGIRFFAERFLLKIKLWLRQYIPEQYLTKYRKSKHQ